MKPLFLYAKNVITPPEFKDSPVLLLWWAALPLFALLLILGVLAILKVYR